MNREFWLERWKNNEIGFHQQEISLHLQNYWQQLALGSGTQVFVPLCGKSGDLLWLLGQGHGVLGVEISPIAVEDFFAENQLKPNVQSLGSLKRYQVDGLVIFLGDFFELCAKDLDNVSGVYDRASLVALPTDMRRQYVRHLVQVIAPDAEILLVAMEYDQTEMNGPPFSVAEEEVRQLYEGRYRITRLFAADLLEGSPRFRERGLSRLTEKVYRLKPR